MTMIIIMPYSRGPTEPIFTNDITTNYTCVNCNAYKVVHWV